MVGIPLFAGFTSKVYFAEAAITASTGKMAVAMIALAISTILNAVYFLRAVVLQDFVILQPFGRAQRIEMFHIDPSFFAFQKSSPILHNEASPCGSMFFLFYHMRIKNPMRIFL